MPKPSQNRPPSPYDLTASLKDRKGGDVPKASSSHPSPYTLSRDTSLRTAGAQKKG